MSKLQYIYDLRIVNSSDELIVINHGGSEGIDSEFIQKIKIKFNNSNTLLIQLPFKTKGDESTSGPSFQEELQSYTEIFEEIKRLNLFTTIKSIRFIGKSVGGLIQYIFIINNFDWLKQFNPNLTAMGYLFDHYELSKEVQFPFHIIQGSMDPWGKIEDISQLVNSYTFLTLDIVEGGNHSYKNEKKEPVFQDTAIKLIIV
ncbi:MAG: alpha/beta family hydrolase [Patescibacteria group bacterium]